MNTLLKRLPKEARDMLRRHEREGTVEAEEHQAAIKLFLGRHLYMLEPWPEVESFAAVERNLKVSSTM